MTVEKAREIFKKYNVNQEVVDSYCSEPWFNYVQDDLEEEIKEWIDRGKKHGFKPLSDEYEASVLFEYLTTD